MKKFLILGMIMSVVAFGKEIENNKLNSLGIELFALVEKTQTDIVRLKEKYKDEIKTDENIQKIKSLMNEVIEYNKIYSEKFETSNERILKTLKEQWNVKNIDFEKIQENIKNEFVANPDIVNKNSKG